MKQNNHNGAFFIIAMGLRTVALLCVTGPIMQTFLASIGFSSQWIYIHTSIVQVVNVMTISLCSTWADRGNVIKRTAMVELPYALLYLLYIPLCIWKSPTLLSFCMLTGICLLQSVCIALWTICEYKLPYFIFSPKEYGSVLSAGGIVGGLISLGTGVVITRLSGILSYAALMLSACAVSMVLMLICAALHLKLKPVSGAPAATEAKKKTNQMEIFRYPVFLRMIPANLMRGFGYGTTTIFAAIALDLGFDTGVATALVSAQSIAALVGCTLFGISISRLPPRFVTLIGSATFGLIPLMLIPNKYLFVAVFALVYLGRTLVDYSVPSILRAAIPVQLAGPFNAWRMLLHNGGTLLATTIAAFIPVTWLLILTVVCQLISGLHYFVSRDLRADQQFK
ncbi:MAG: hypothetical protein IKJ99_00650 [Oscillospiraceae bacterium]|nr:hypothetical protein [Oscillospiraceae bacterium]